MQKFSVMITDSWVMANACPWNYVTLRVTLSTKEITKIITNRFTTQGCLPSSVAWEAMKRKMRHLALLVLAIDCTTKWSSSAIFYLKWFHFLSPGDNTWKQEHINFSQWLHLVYSSLHLSVNLVWNTICYVTIIVTVGGGGGGEFHWETTLDHVIDVARIFRDGCIRPGAPMYRGHRGPRHLSLLL